MRRGISSAVAGAAAAAFAVWGAAAQSATFDMVSGEVVNGDILKFGERYVALRAEAGGLFQILARSDIRAVSVDIGGERVVSGALVDWRQGGAYHVKSPDGRLYVARDGLLLSSAAAPETEERAASAPRVAAEARTSAGAAVELGDSAATLSLTDPLIQDAIVAAAEDLEQALSAPRNAAAPSTTAEPQPQSGPTAAARLQEDNRLAAAIVPEISTALDRSIPALTLPAPDAALEQDVRAALNAVIMGDQAATPRPTLASRAAARPSTPASAYVEGVAPRHGRSGAVCAPLVDLTAPMGAPSRGNASALIVGVDAGSSASPAAALAQAFFGSGGIAATLAPPSPADPSGSLWTASQPEPASVFRPERLSARKGVAGDLAVAMRRGEVDVRIGGRMARGDRSTLIGFEAIAAAANPETGLRRLSLAQLRDLLSGGAPSLAALGGLGETALTVYLPEEGSPERRHLAALLGLREIVAPGSQSIVDARARAEAAAKDPAGLALVASSAAAGLRRLHIGDAKATAAAPIPSAIQSGDYPLTRPLYVSVGEADKAHAAAEAFARFAQSAAAYDALRRVGVLPVAACATGACGLSAPGFDDAIAAARFDAGAAWSARLAPARAPQSAAPIAQIPESRDRKATLASFIDAWRATPSIAPKVVLRPGGGVSPDRAAVMALALRCAGMTVSGVAPASADGAPRIDLFAR